MPHKLFVSLPIADVARSQKFFAALGLAFNPRFTGANAVCLALNEQVEVMLVARDFYQTLTPKPVGDPQAWSQALLALCFDSREQVDAVHGAALAAGATNGGDTDDYGFMYQKGFNDLDGHQWAVTWMDESQMPAPDA
ncbi:VOC family protein [Cognatilysobacter lacus]|uniref:Glyoxalase/bleomycin resistance/extradiol dioxygenase family protein n=1 Tax=Cognatilysobacter lacus TaxID=1643323 RepID=A0A5D8Z5U1_9GAMM|nr:glyoxalase/bleomycin resistance/extradiol dioxygenase family protein [Lysobacter lacus]TZF90119.1 glyoxalase/bleomycin resistance/extradiol dioxygenase family protein [Lysobacter lacus]